MDLLFDRLQISYLFDIIWRLTLKETMLYCLDAKTAILWWVTTCLEAKCL